MNTAEVIKFPGPEPGQEKRVADLEDGYTRTANELLEAVMLSGLTQHQLLIVMAVWRKTYGYNKKMDWIGNEQFAGLTGMAATKCSTARNELIRMGVLVQQGRQVGMNKAVSEWKTKFNGFSKTFTESVKKTFPESVKSDLPKRSNTKDNITKDNKDIKNIGGDEKKKSPKKVKKSTQRSPDFYPSAKHESLAHELGVNLQNEFLKFVDYHDSKGTTFKNWDAALNMWLRNAVRYGKSTQRNVSRPSQPMNYIPEGFTG